jgi:surfactin synthase thioesterase subunit
MTGTRPAPGPLAGPWLRSFVPLGPAATGPPPATRLVCFPHAGASAGAYARLARALAGSAQVLVVQYPGRQDRRREPLIGDVTELAGRVAAVLEPGLDRALAFFGHSMGATVAFEAARELERRHAVPLAHLFASGRRAPSTSRPPRPPLADDAAAAAELLALSGTDERLLADPEVAALILPVVRGDYQAIERYHWQPGPPLGAPITALVGDADPLTTVAEAAAWATHTRAPFRLRVFPGGHFYLDDRLAEVATLIGAKLGAGPD